MAGVVSPRVDVEGASQRVKRERAVDAARLAIVHVASHSRQRHKVVTVIVLASVSTFLPWQNGHAVGRLITSFNRDSDIVGVFHLAFIKVFALFTNAHESERPRPCPARRRDSWRSQPTVSRASVSSPEAEGSPVAWNLPVGVHCSTTELEAAFALVGNNVGSASMRHPSTPLSDRAAQRCE
jgi:hypothetical protein